MKPRIGRPPRMDEPMPTTLLLPAAMKRWLRSQSEREGRGMGAIVEDGLRLYERKADARAKRADGRRRGRA